MDLWPCSSNDLRHLPRQEWLTRNIKKRSDKSAVANGAGLTGLTSNLSGSGNVIYPDTSKMVAYDPRQKPAFPVSVPPSNLSSPFTAVHGGNSNGVILKTTPALAAFLASLPPVEGPTPHLDIVLSICVQSNIPATVQVGKLGTHKKHQMSNASDVSKCLPNRSTSSFKGGDRKRKYPNRQEENDNKCPKPTSPDRSFPNPSDAESSSYFIPDHSLVWERNFWRFLRQYQLNIIRSKLVNWVTESSSNIEIELNYLFFGSFQ